MIKLAGFQASGGARMKLRLPGTVKRSNVQHRTSNIDGIVKSRFKDWVPAFAGMTPVVSI
jgi:hypothetical protein